MISPSPVLPDHSSVERQSQPPECCSSWATKRVESPHQETLILDFPLLNVAPASLGREIYMPCLQTTTIVSAPTHNGGYFRFTSAIPVFMLFQNCLFSQMWTWSSMLHWHCDGWCSRPGFCLAPTGHQKLATPLLGHYGLAKASIQECPGGVIHSCCYILCSW